MEELTGHGFYVTIPMALLTNQDISPNAKLTFGLVANLSNQRGYCFATNEYMSKILNVHEKTISKHISELIKNDWLIPFDEVTKTGLQRRLALSENAKMGVVKTLRGGTRKADEGVRENVTHNKQSIINKVNRYIDCFLSEEDAYQEMTSNYKDSEAWVRILKDKGWMAVTEIDTSALLYHFLASKVDLEKDKKDVRQHFKNWLGKIELNELIKLSVTIKANHERKQRSQA